MDLDAEELYESDDFIVPRDLRKLRACLVCGLVKTWEQFHTNDCDNCKQYLSALEYGNEMTTTNFDGMIALMEPKTSWVAKWQRTTTRVPGCYAVVVHGRLPGHLISALEDAGLAYHPLDTSEQ